MENSVGEDKMTRIKFEVIFNHNERASLNRPAWTSEQSTGLFNAHAHKHSTERGRFKLSTNYWARKKV